MARSPHPGRALEALKRYKFQGFSNFSKPHVLPGLGLLGTILGPDLVPVYMYIYVERDRDGTLDWTPITTLDIRVTHTTLFFAHYLSDCSF